MFTLHIRIYLNDFHREEYANLEAFCKAKKLRVTTEMGEGAGYGDENAMEVDEDDDDDDEESDNDRQARKRSREDGGDEDSESGMIYISLA
jgi:cobalamin biosynthesis protein CobT